MAIVLKRKRQEQPLVDGQFSTLAALIDKAGQLGEEAELIKARIKKEEAKLKAYQGALKELQAALAGLGGDADTPLEMAGASFHVWAGAQGVSRSIKDLHQIRKMLGDETFMQLALVKIGDLDKYLTPPQLEQVLATERGTRSLKLTRKAH